MNEISGYRRIHRLLFVVTILKAVDREFASPLSLAVLDCDAAAVHAALNDGADPNQTWGGIPLITHAALNGGVEVFRLLKNAGGDIPPDFFDETFTWELFDWRIDTDDAYDGLLAILKDMKQSGNWPEQAERERLIARLGSNYVGPIGDLLRQA